MNLAKYSQPFMALPVINSTDLYLPKFLMYRLKSKLHAFSEK